MIPRIQRRNQRTPMGRISYTGLTPQQLMQRQGGRVAIGGGPSIIQSTTGQKEEDQGLLGAALGAKNTYDGVKAVYKGGNNLIDAAKKFPGQLENYYNKAKTEFQGLLGDSGQSGVSQGAWQGPPPPINETTMSPWDGMSNSQPVNTNLGSTGINPNELQFGASQANNPLALSTASRSGLEFAPESLASLGGRASNAWSRVTGLGTQEALAGTFGHTGGAQLGAGGGEAAAQTGGAAAAQAGGQAAAKAGGDAAAKAASGGSIALGAAGGFLGAGLAVNDIVENGASVSNVAGLVSGMAFAAAPFLAAAGPVGWVALGVGAIASMFDW